VLLQSFSQYFPRCNPPFPPTVETGMEIAPIDGPLGDSAIFNDPYAGSPTKTLLRLLLPNGF